MTRKPPATMRPVAIATAAARRNRCVEIARQVAAHFDVPVDDIFSETRDRSIAFARMVAMYLANREGLSSAQIAIAFQRDRTMVSYAFDRVTAAMERDAVLRRAVTTLRATALGNPIEGVVRHVVTEAAVAVVVEIETLAAQAFELDACGAAIAVRQALSDFIARRTA